jgi:hypothetical protein
MELWSILWVAIPVGIGCILGYAFRDYDTTLDTNIVDKLKELSKYIANAGGSIKMATDFDPRFFDDERVKKSFERALRRGVKVQLLTDMEPPEWYKNKDGIEIKRVERLQYRFWVIGNGCVRMEKENGIGVIFKDLPKLAEIYGNEFDILWMAN